jgi:hypothetical protein
MALCAYRVSVFVALGLIVMTLFCSVGAEIIHYDNHFIVPKRPEYLVIPKFDKSEVPDWSPGRGRSYIDLSHLKLRSACDIKNNMNGNPGGPRLPFDVDKDSCKAAVFDLLMFKASMNNPDHTWKDFWGDKGFCCTQEMVEKGEYVLAFIPIWSCLQLYLNIISFVFSQLSCVKIESIDYSE